MLLGLLQLTSIKPPWQAKINNSRVFRGRRVVATSSVLSSSASVSSFLLSGSKRSLILFFGSTRGCFRRDSNVPMPFRESLVKKEILGWFWGGTFVIFVFVLDWEQKMIPPPLPTCSMWLKARGRCPPKVQLCSHTLESYLSLSIDWFESLTRMATSMGS